MTLCIPEPGVYNVTVYYEENILHDGQFECIVLTGKFTTTHVQRRQPVRHWPFALLEWVYDQATMEEINYHVLLLISI